MPTWKPHNRGLVFSAQLNFAVAKGRTSCKRVDIMSKSTCDTAALGFIEHKFTPTGQKLCHRPKVCYSQEVWFNLICVRLISIGDNDQFSTENKESPNLPLCLNVYSLGLLWLIHNYSHLNLSEFIDKIYVFSRPQTPYQAHFLHFLQCRWKTKDCRCYIILQEQSSYSSLFHKCLN